MNTDFYKLFNLSLAKQKGILTDEMVKENYLSKRKQYFQMIKKTGEKKEDHSLLEIKEVLDDDYLKLLDEAYEAIKTEENRKEYDELLANSKKESKAQPLSESKHPSSSTTTSIHNNDHNTHIVNHNNTSNNATKDISFVPIYKGNFGQLPPKKSSHSTSKKESKDELNSSSKNDHNDDLDI